MALNSDTRLVALLYRVRGEGDEKIRALASTLAGEGFHLAGMVQDTAPVEGEILGDMEARFLGATPGSAMRISERRGRDSEGCRLDSGALEDVAGKVEASITEGIDLLVLSKFGKREAEGAGFRQAIGKALGLDIPVLTAVNEEIQPLFLEFTGDLGVIVEDPAEALAWARGLKAG
jgi:hypothetical protein